MEGYLKFDSLNNEYIEKCDEYLQTGDIGYINNNELFIKGRLSRMVTMKNGCKFYCDDYEKRIKSLSYIDDAAVICDNEADKEREVLLFLKFIKNEKREFKVFKTVDYIRKNMNPFEYPTKVYVVDKFPLLSSMKKDYVLLKKYAKTKILKRVL